MLISFLTEKNTHTEIPLIFVDQVEQYGTKKAKVSLSVLDRLADCAEGKYVVIAGYVIEVYIFLPSKISP